jgi:hypothetical protein
MNCYWRKTPWYLQPQRRDRCGTEAENKNCTTTGNRTLVSPAVGNFFANCTNSVRFVFLTVSSIKMAVFWVVAACNLLDVSEVIAVSIIRAMTEAASTSKTSASFYQATRRNSPEDSHVDIRADHLIIKRLCPWSSYTLWCSSMLITCHKHWCKIDKLLGLPAYTAAVPALA